MLRTLTRAGVKADFVVGSSVGAINAAYFAGDPTTAGIRKLEAIWRGVTRGKVFPARPARSLLALLGARNSVISPSSLRLLLEEHISYETLEAATIPCHVVATDVSDGAEILLSNGSAVEALLASSAIPGVFPPVALDGRELIDGGITSNTPIAAAVGLGARRVIVLPTGVSCRIERAPRDAMGVVLHALNLLIARQLARDAERFGAEVELTVVPPLCPLARSAYDFSGTSELIERAAEHTQRWLDEDGLSHHDVPDALKPHAHGTEADESCPWAVPAPRPLDEIHHGDATELRRSHDDEKQA